MKGGITQETNGPPPFKQQRLSPILSRVAAKRQPAPRLQTMATVITESPHRSDSVPPANHKAVKGKQLPLHEFSKQQRHKESPLSRFPTTIKAIRIAETNPMESVQTMTTDSIRHFCFKPTAKGRKAAISLSSLSVPKPHKTCNRVALKKSSSDNKIIKTSSKPHLRKAQFLQRSFSKNVSVSCACFNKFYYLSR